jgi:hypothetical protein
MVQLYCCVFTFVVFVGDGWMALVPAHLPHLRLLGLEECGSECDERIDGLVTAAPKLVVINCRGDVVGPLSNEQLETASVCGKSEKYDIIRQWALDILPPYWKLRLSSESCL